MSDWPDTFRRRMAHFEHTHHSDGAIPVSIKVRVNSGCFHREHSPQAYRIIDDHLGRLADDESFAFEEHESGPEILIYVAAATAGVVLAKSVIELVTTIINARSEGIKKGDSPDYPVELIVRRVHRLDEIREEIVLRVDSMDKVEPAVIAKKLNEAADKIIRDGELQQ